MRHRKEETGTSSAAAGSRKALRPKRKRNVVPVPYAEVRGLRPAAAGRLVVASNRLPVVLRPNGGGEWEARTASGGLVTALSPVMARKGGVWVGWPGVPGVEEDAVEQALTAASGDRPYRFLPVKIAPEEEERFYRGFANSALWPLFHGFPDRCRPSPGDWEAYREVNRRFAGALLETAAEGDLVWVHDYHLMLVARHLRAAGMRNRLAFFLHIPFPRSELLTRLPGHRELLEGLRAFDLLGFQTAADRNNFEEAVRDLLPGDRVSPDRPPHGSREDAGSAGRSDLGSRSGAFPISIDYEEFSRGAEAPEVRELAEKVRERAGDRTLVLGVDRLDYSKGIPERLRGLGHALEHFPELRGRIVLEQLVVPSRESVPAYAETKAEIEELVARINGRWGRDGWLPVRYRYESWDRPKLLAHYRTADAALVTPLNDGMNLVAKEFCAASEGDGVLILSAFAGAAGELGRGALLVDPADVRGVAAAIRAAHFMAPDERRERMALMKEAVRRKDVHRWVDDFLRAAG